jgi:hypothetical protein
MMSRSKTSGTLFSLALMFFSPGSEAEDANLSSTSHFDGDELRDESRNIEFTIKNNNRSAVCIDDSASYKEGRQHLEIRDPAGKMIGSGYAPSTPFRIYRGLQEETSYHIVLPGRAWDSFVLLSGYKFLPRTTYQYVLYVHYYFCEDIQKLVKSNSLTISSHTLKISGRFRTK